MALPFEEHFNTNYAPSDTELLEISRILREPQRHLARVDDEIERIQATLDGLKQQRGELVQHTDRYLALTSPVRRIPQDILQEIFVNCLPSNHNAIMSAREAPLLLGRVCSSWRSISLSTPLLWTTVHVPMPNTSTNFYSSEIPNSIYVVASKNMAELRTAALQEWLNRSGSLPVDISLSQWDETPTAINMNPHESQPIVDVILSVARRWREITVAASARSMACFLRHPPHDLPFLESLDFTFSRIRSWEPISELPQSEQSIYRTPSLRRLSLMQPQGDFLQLPVNWEHLTDLTIEGRSWGLGSSMSVHRVMELLSHCPRLVRCRLAIPTAEVTLAQFPSLTLPNLERLSMFEYADLTNMFDRLDLPALCDVEYHTAISPNVIKQSSLLTLLRKSDGSIQKFTTDPQLLMREDLLECLRLIPEATTLNFTRPRIQTMMAVSPADDLPILDKELLYSFLPSARDALCPKLKFLEISSRLNFSDEDLLGFVLKKQRGVPVHSLQFKRVDLLKLKRVRVIFLRSRRMDIVPHLTGLVKEGLDLQLTYPAQPGRAPFSPSEGLPNVVPVYNG